MRTRVHLRIHGHNGVLAACHSVGKNRIRTDQVTCKRCLKTFAFKVAKARSDAAKMSSTFVHKELKRLGIIK